MRTRTNANEITRLLDPNEAAEALGVKVQTLAIWRSTKRYDLPFVKIGRSVKYRRESIEKFIEDNTVNCHGL